MFCLRESAVTLRSFELSSVSSNQAPFANVFGLTPLPAMFFPFLGGTVMTYLLLVELVKRRLMGRRQPLHQRPSRLR